MTDKIKAKSRNLWIYTKYQIITKFIISIIILPIFSVTADYLIKLSGRNNISSGDYIEFFMSIYGVPLILFGIVVLIFIIGLDINSLIIISSLVQEKKYKVSILSVLKKGIKSVKLFFSPLGIVLVLYISFILPLLNFSISIGIFKRLRIPKFITSVIFNTPSYTIIYMIILTLLFILSIIYIFTIHFIVIENKSLRESLKSSRLLMKKYWKNFIKDYFVKLIKYGVFSVCAVFLLVLSLLVFDYIISLFYFENDATLIWLFISIFEFIVFLMYMSIPIAIHILTKLFYIYNKKENKEIKINFETDDLYVDKNIVVGKFKSSTKIMFGFLVITLLVFNLFISTYMQKNFETLFKTKVNVKVIGHRAGGDLGAENTLEGVTRAYNRGASFVEIDVQRTKDNKYIINHDKTFKRVSGVDKTPMEMTLKEIKKLRVKNEFNPKSAPQEVPTLEEILDASKGRVGVFVELKGKSANTKMVDDVIKIINNKNMVDECVILSLDYDIIKYTKKKYPNIKTGFLYFFAVGDLKDLKGDYLIMEEREATEEKIYEIHDAGKKAIVWTVNTQSSIDKFIYSDVDGIITDHIPLVNDAIKASKERSHIEILLFNLLSGF